MFIVIAFKLFEFILQTILAGLLAYFGVLYTTSRRNRIEKYDVLLKEFFDSCDRIHNLSIMYWASNGKNELIEYQILNGQMECERLIESLNEKQCEFFQYEDIKKKMFEYIVIITGEGFENENRKSSKQKIVQSSRILVEIKNLIESSKFPNYFKARAFAKIK